MKIAVVVLLARWVKYQMRGKVSVDLCSPVMLAPNDNATKTLAKWTFRSKEYLQLAFPVKLERISFLQVTGIQFVKTVLQAHMHSAALLAALPSPFVLQGSSSKTCR